MVRFASVSLFGEPGDQIRSNMTLVEPTGKEKDKSVEAEAKLDTARYGFI